MLRRAPIHVPAAPLAACIALLATGCFLPPPAEDKPLSDAVDRAPRVDSSVGGDDGGAAEVAIEAEDPSAEGSLDPEVEEAAAPVAQSPEADPTTAVVGSEAEQGTDGTDETAGPAEVNAGDVNAGEGGEDPPGGAAAEDPEASTDAGAGQAADTEAEQGAPAATGESVLDGAADPEQEGSEARSDAGELVPADVEETVVEIQEEPEASAQDGAAGSGPRAGVVQTSDGLEMSYTVRGPLEGNAADGPTIVFVHGWCGSGAQWAGAAAALPAARVVVVDLLGHGASREQARAEWTVPRFGADVTRMLEAEELRDVVLVGHGMGGQVCLEVAVRAPERVGAIVGVDCLQRLAGDPNPGRLQQYVETFRRDYEGQMRQFVIAALGDGAKPELAEGIVNTALAAPREMALALMEHFGVHDPRRAAPRIECRVICINSATLATDVQGNRALLSSFDVEVLDGVGHWIHLEAPERFAQALREILAELAPAPEGPRVLQSLSPVLVVEDPGKVAAFYTERLSFRIVRRTPQDLAEPAALIALERDGARVVVQSLASLRDELPGAEIAPRAGVLFLRVDSLDAELAALGEGVKTVGRERELPSGARQVVIADPEGNLVVLQQAAPAPSGG